MTFREIDTTGFRPAQLRDQMQPTMVWARVTDLVIDDRYQRQITPAGRRTIQAIADKWDWRLYQPIIVAPSDGGRMAVVDGQHRAHAAAVCGIEALPAMMIPMTPREQAKAFHGLNTERTRLHPTAVYRARLAAGDPAAIAMRDAVEAGGCTLMTYVPSYKDRKGGQIFAIGLIERMVTNGEASAVTAGLRAIIASEAAGQEPDNYGTHLRIWDAPVLTVWLAAIASNQQFLSIDLTSVFDEIDWFDLLDRSRARARLQGKAARQIAIEEVKDRLRDALGSARANKMEAAQ